MKTNKLDNNIKEKFAKRTFEPSASAWERLSTQLDEQPKQKKKGWFFYIGAAASILLLVSIGVQIFTDDKELIIPQNEVVIEQIDKDLIDEKIDQFLNEIPTEEVIVKTDKVEEKHGVEKNNILTKQETQNKINNNVVVTKIDNVIPKKEESQKAIDKKNFINNINNVIPTTEESIAKVDNNLNVIPVLEESLKIKFLKEDPNSTIKINSDDLLYAVTHSPQEVKTYYAKHNITRDDVLKTIQNQLKESNLKINPESILAEVERTINNDDFQNNFLESLKRRVSDIATAIASRNN